MTQKPPEGILAPQWILAIDTALGGCQVALVCPQSRRVVSKGQDGMRGQTEILLPLINDTLTEAGIAYADLGLVAAITGPGSFTGIRVGLAVANALQFGLDIPAVGLDAFTAWQAMLAAKGEQGPYKIVLETFRADLFVADMADNTAEAQNTQISLPEEMLAEDGVVYAGGGLVRVPHIASPYTALDLGLAVTHLHDNVALAKLRSNDSLSPYYMRDADTSESRQKMWKIS